MGKYYTMKKLIELSGIYGGRVRLPQKKVLQPIIIRAEAINNYGITAGVNYLLIQSGGDLYNKLQRAAAAAVPSGGKHAKGDVKRFIISAQFDLLRCSGKHLTFAELSEIYGTNSYNIRYFLTTHYDLLQFDTGYLDKYNNFCDTLEKL
ncbi:MAG: hypothetical protein QM280_03615 [Bacteroidota bacterium]|jgi:hypothetical protein|nr:hypothetical protein [Bacteroidota bacterium]HPB84233.1 hypothetical protein [Paludibacteraceae bacterium]